MTNIALTVVPPMMYDKMGWRSLPNWFYLNIDTIQAKCKLLIVNFLRRTSVVYNIKKN